MTLPEYDSQNILQGVLLASSVQSAIEIIQDKYKIDFVTFHLMNNVKSHADNPFVRTTYPSDWVSYYLLHNLVANDPIVRHLLAYGNAFSWSDVTINAAQKAMMDKSLEFGLGREGYSVPYTDTMGRTSIFSLNSKKPSDEWGEFLAAHSSDLRALSQDLHVKALAEAFADHGSTTPHLSPREYECLRWTAEGKTYTEIAMILSLSEHTVRSYLKVVRLKLDCVSLAQAVSKANTMGLILQR